MKNSKAKGNLYFKKLKMINFFLFLIKLFLNFKTSIFILSEKNRKIHIRLHRRDRSLFSFPLRFDLQYLA